MIKMIEIGVDEAGRGPLFGDVYAAAVILPENYNLPFLNDSKKISSTKRDILFTQICEQALFGIVHASVVEIESLNILNASLLAMQRAIDILLEKLEKSNNENNLNKNNINILIDGIHTPERLLLIKNNIKNDIKNNDILKTLENIEKIKNNNFNNLNNFSNLNYQAIKGGDASHAAISAASILAKVTRDQSLILADERYPEYGLAKHKGYGTAMHIAKIKEHGASPEHRASFLKFLKS